jgi:membrane associated rhomboid family serine protease
MKLRYNAPVILSFSLICAIVLLISQITGGVLIDGFFSISPMGFSLASPLSWFRLISHVIGHANWTHLIANFSFILLIGPVLEEKYGSLPLLVVMLVTAVATGILDLLIIRAQLLGASGIVFALILLSSFTNIRSGEIPVTFILIVVLYLVKEFLDALSPSPVANLAHILGGVVGALFGFVFSKKDEPKKPIAPKTDQKTIGGNAT